ncbi:MAG: hypothetical protein IM583_06080 [Pseudanabaena sp. M114S2SP2A07QC]|nr:hypothetical protein [Pseudanabaena sp. M114S2SP2A07QC]
MSESIKVTCANLALGDLTVDALLRSSIPKILSPELSKFIFDLSDLASQ